MTFADSKGRSYLFEKYVLCRCGRMFYPGQEKEMWECVESHTERDRFLKDYQKLVEYVGRT